MAEPNGSKGGLDNYSKVLFNHTINVLIYIVQVPAETLWKVYCRTLWTVDVFQ